MDNCITQNELIVETTMGDVNGSVAKLSVPRQYDERSLLQIKTGEIRELNSDYSKSRIINTSGLCIFEIDVFKESGGTSQVRVNGRHIRFSFVFDNVRHASSGSSGEVASVTGKAEIAVQNAREYIFPLKAGHVYRVVSIMMSPEYYLGLFGTDTLVHNFDIFRAVSENGVYRSGVGTYRINLAIRNVLYKILDNPFRDLLKRNYVDSKIKGLVSLLHEQELNNVHKRKLLPGDDHGKLESAREILNNSLQNPPTISQLSKLISLNEMKLKQGFKVLHGATIRNYLIKRRMEAAYIMLREEGVMIFEVAMKLGYKDTSHFISVFKKYYGYTPKFFLKRMEEKI